MADPITIHCPCGVDYDGPRTRYLRCPCCGHVWDVTPPGSPHIAKDQRMSAGVDARCNLIVHDVQAAKAHAH